MQVRHCRAAWSTTAAKHASASRVPARQALAAMWLSFTLALPCDTSSGQCQGHPYQWMANKHVHAYKHVVKIIPGNICLRKVFLGGLYAYKHMQENGLRGTICLQACENHGQCACFEEKLARFRSAIERCDGEVQWWKSCSLKVPGKGVWERRAIDWGGLGVWFLVSHAFHSNCCGLCMACIQSAARTTTH
jgi:hypothetical protein